MNQGRVERYGKTRKMKGSRGESGVGKRVKQVSYSVGKNVRKGGRICNT